MTPRWIVYLDLDGTLLSSRLTVSDRARAALRAAESSAQIVLTSGRPTVSCMTLASDLLTAPQVVISANGGAVVDCKARLLLEGASFQPGAAAAIASIARSADLVLCAHHPFEWYARQDDRRILVEVNRSGSTPTFVRELEPYLSGAVKLMLIGHPSVVKGLCPLMNQIASINAFITYPEYLEIMPTGFDKARAARVARDFLAGQDEVRTIAIGDGLADLPLFAFVDHAVAVANAHEHVRRAATHIAPSNDDDGAAVAVEALVLGLEESRAALSEVTRLHRPEISRSLGAEASHTYSSSNKKRGDRDDLHCG